ncbi:MAG: TVP38/TMEM64 family protein [Chitinophagaceae bacterium]
MPGRVKRNSVLLMLMVLIFILVPFFCFHSYIDNWTNDLINTPGQKLSYIAILLCLLLIADIILPVPSSVISIGAGYLLGFYYAVLVSFTGMALACILGYWLGKRSGNAIRWLDEETKLVMEKFFHQAGKWAIIIARPVPVLAEASIFFAGISRMNFPAFIWASFLSNLGISIVYAAIGVYAVSVNSVLLAFSAAMILPAIAFGLQKFFNNKARNKLGKRIYDR